MPAHEIIPSLAQGHPTLMGQNDAERNEILQLLRWHRFNVKRETFHGWMAVTSRSEDYNRDEFNRQEKSHRWMLIELDERLRGDWLVGSDMTVADIVLACAFALPFQLLLDMSFSQREPKADKIVRWFDKMIALPIF